MGSSNHYNSSCSNYIKNNFTFQELLEKGISQMKICQKSSGFPEIRKIKIIYQGCIVDCDPKLELSPNCTLPQSRSENNNSAEATTPTIFLRDKNKTKAERGSFLKKPSFDGNGWRTSILLQRGESL